MIRLTLPDGSVREVPPGTTGRDLAASIGPGLAKAALAIRVDGQVRDLSRPIDADATVSIITDKDPDALDVLRHSSAHILATAVRELFPGAGIGFGPAIEDGFYYDFDVPRPFAPEDLERIEQQMGEVAKRDYPFVREVVDREEANRRFADDPLKLERIAELGPDETITVYTDGPFQDLCRGPHLPGTGRLKHFKLLHAAGAYWRGDERRQMLQRIYGTSWFKKEDLDAYLNRLEEARKRDHRVLGKQLDLYSISEIVGPGLVLLAPQGRHHQVAPLPRGGGRQRRERVRPGLHPQRDPRGAVLHLRPPAALRGQPVPGHGRGRGRERGDALSGEADELPDALPHLPEPAAELPRPAHPPLRGRQRLPEREVGHAPRDAPGARALHGRRPHLLHHGAGGGRDLPLPRPGGPAGAADVRVRAGLRDLHPAGRAARRGRRVGPGGGGAPARARAEGDRLQTRRRRRRVLRTQDRHQVQGRHRAAVAGAHDPARFQSAGAVRAGIHRRPTTGRTGR